MEDVQKVVSSPIGKQALADVANFARKATSITVEEHTII